MQEAERKRVSSGDRKVQERRGDVATRIPAHSIMLVLMMTHTQTDDDTRHTPLTMMLVLMMTLLRNTSAYANTTLLNRI